MGGVFKLRIVLSGMLDSEETVYRFSVLQGMGALDGEISAVYVKEAELEEFLLDSKSLVISPSDIKERAKYLPVFPEKVKSKTDGSCIKSGKSQLVSCVKEDGVYRVGFFNRCGEFLSEYGEGALSRLLGEVFCGKAILLKSELIDSSVYELLSGMSDKMSEVLNDLSRGKLTGGDLSESSFNGVFGDSPTVKSEGLKGVGNGVNVYSKYASSVSVSAKEIQATGTAILDMSKCSLLSEFSLYDECDDDDLPETCLDKLTLIFPSGVGNLRGDSFTVTAGELCIQNLEVLGSFKEVALCDTALSGVSEIIAENIVMDSCSGLEKLTISAAWYNAKLNEVNLYNLPTLSELNINWFQEGTALSIEECQNLSKVYIKCVAGSSWSGLNLARIAGDTEAGRGLFYQSHTSIRELRVECSSFSCSERIVDITREFPDLEKLCLTGNLEINQSDFILVVPRGCKVDCSDRRLRSKVVSRQE